MGRVNEIAEAFICMHHPLLRYQHEVCALQADEQIVQALELQVPVNESDVGF